MKKKLQSKDLRIGNWYMSDLMIENIFQIEAEDILDIDKGIVDYYAIPLNEDWLIGLGFFKRWVQDEMYYEKSIDGTDSIRVLKSDFSYGTYVFDKLAHCPQPNIPSVHELQNLYFALTGEELELKNETKL